ncbi:Ni,Fe-hydrogenase I cytochrome b subunit [hydrothermal vent metagenome]|uniref:Ni,Fe-hydrogenase I cytochrome b subunit n=1 Tax=hydrothermal vent metagenome TaxID=652676 RepID=A0A3B1BD92_9ZZZZ
MKSNEKVKVWDPFVRVFHWALLLAFTVAFVTEFSELKLHVVAGYTVALLVSLRIIWGVIGEKNAKFSDFVYPPATVVAHMKEMARLRHKRYLGHNPAAGTMALLLIVCLAATTLTGVLTYGAKEISGPFSTMLLNSGWRYGNELEGIHNFLAWSTVLLAMMHVTGALTESFLHKENLVLAMFTGVKRKELAVEHAWEGPKTPLEPVLLLKSVTQANQFKE